MSIAGVVIGLIAIPVSYYFGRWARKSPSIRTAIDFDRIVTPGDWGVSDVHLAVAGGQYQQVSRTLMAIWHDGGDTLRGTDVLLADPLRIDPAAGHEILLARVITISRSQIAASIDRSGRINFDFMDRGDGFVLEVLHTGKRPVTFAGTIPGARVKRQREATLDASVRERMRSSWLRTAFNLRDRRQSLWLLILAFALLSFTLGVFLLLQHQAPTVVPVRGYDLTSLEGQQDFANAVSEQDRTPDRWILILTGGVYGTLALLTTPRRVVPRSVVANEIIRLNSAIPSQNSNRS